MGDHNLSGAGFFGVLARYVFFLIKVYAGGFSNKFLKKREGSVTNLMTILNVSVKILGKAIS